MISEDQLEDLQTRLAYQEHTLSQLNDVVIGQQAELERLRIVVRDLLQMVGDERGSASPASVEEKPPHY